MPDFFLYGTLRHMPLLEVVLGRPARARRAWLEDHAARWAAGESFPLIVPEPRARAQGILVEGLSADEAARLDFYEGGFGYGARDSAVMTEDGPAAARVYFPEPGRWRVGEPFDLDEWGARWGAVVVEAARDFMAAFGHRNAEEVLARYPSMLLRAAARLRARRGGPTLLRRAAAAGDISVEDRRQPYAKFFAVEETDLRFRGFRGGMNGPVTRAAFVMADAVTVLPYDPQRDRVLVVEQFRMGPFARGDTQPWAIETIAGRVDADESPEAAARREAQEEARLELRDLIAVCGYYPSPGAVTEYIYSYVALVDLPDEAAGLGGLDSETEDIRAHVIGFDRLMQLIGTGEVESGPLVLSAFWLAGRREELRGGA